MVRDQFATAALMSLARSQSPSSTATDAYDYADAMMLERDRRIQEQQEAAATLDSEKPEPFDKFEP